MACTIHLMRLCFTMESISTIGAIIGFTVVQGSCLQWPFYDGQAAGGGGGLAPSPLISGD